MLIMKQSELLAIARNLTDKFPPDINGANTADIYVLLGKELGMTHLLLPEARPDGFYDIDLPDAAPELYRDRADRSEKVTAFIMARPRFGASPPPASG